MIDVFDCIKEIVGVFAPIITIFIALYGLTIWKEKLRGENKYSRAIDVLNDLYILKEEIKNFRNPFYSADELYQAYEKVEGGNGQKVFDSKKAKNYAENIRWNKVVEQYEKYNSSLIRLKVIIDSFDLDVIEGTSVLKYLKELNAARLTEQIQENQERSIQYLDLEQRKDYFEKKEKMFSILNDMGNNNEFTMQIEDYFFKMTQKINIKRI